MLHLYNLTISLRYS